MMMKRMGSIQGTLRRKNRLNVIDCMCSTWEKLSGCLLDLGFEGLSEQWFYSQEKDKRRNHFGMRG